MKKSAVILAALSLCLSQAATAKEVSADVVKKIQEAAPSEAPAKPKKARRVLVYSVANGFVHGSIPTGNKAMQVLGEKTGAYDVTVSNDLANFEKDALAQFDLVILNNTTGELFKPKPPRKPRQPDPKKIKDEAKLAKAREQFDADMKKWEVENEKFKAMPDPSERLRANLMEWVKSGKGLAGFHSASDSCYSWKEYGQCIGGYFTGHPWHMDVTLKNDDPTNPINAAFEGKSFDVKDEIYQFARGVYDRKNQRVLLSLDMEKTPNKGKREDQDYAVSWVKKHGDGRVFYCSLGHRDEIFWNPKVLRHYLAGFQWAIGDLDGVTITPNPLP